MVAKTDDGWTHYLQDGLGGGEILVHGPDIWMGDESGAWELDEDAFELPFMVGFVTPDYAYLAAYSVFDLLEFDSWAESDGQSVAVYRGGPEAAQTILSQPSESRPRDDDGFVEAWWSTNGYFTMVEARVADTYGQVRYGWTITDVGTTQVEPPA